MSHGRTWIVFTERTKRFLERREAEQSNLSDVFYANFNRLNAQGDVVVLSAGKSCMFDEKVLFETGADAQNFFDSGFMRFEPFIIGGGEGTGFQEVSLYRGGKLVATKSSAPTKRSEAKNE